MSLFLDSANQTGKVADQEGMHNIQSKQAPSWPVIFQILSSFLPLMKYIYGIYQLWPTTYFMQLHFT